MARHSYRVWILDNGVQTLVGTFSLAGTSCRMVSIALQQRLPQIDLNKVLFARIHRGSGVEGPMCKAAVEGPTP